MKVKTTQYGNIKEILKYPTHHVGVAVMVSDAGVTAGSDGRKIVPAGTLVGSTEAGVVTAINGEQTEGVLLSDADVTHGAAPATMVVHGFIDKTKIPEEPTDEAKAAIPMVLFI